MTGIPSQFNLIQKLLTEASLRHQVVSQNVANVNTPGFKAKEVVSFAEAVNDATGRDGTHLSIRFQDGLTARLDGNNVDIDKEIGAFNKNALLHNAYTQVLATKIGQMRSAISDR
jgi:flagellar basal-body rod protein FlgB